MYSSFYSTNAYNYFWSMILLMMLIERAVGLVINSNHTRQKFSLFILFKQDFLHCALSKWNRCSYGETYVACILFLAHACAPSLDVD